jgi:antitoxin ParD1/3/4
MQLRQGLARSHTRDAWARRDGLFAIVAVMNITLTSEQEELVRAKVESGGYESPAEVLGEALLLLEERDGLRAIRRERLLRDLAAGVFQADNRQLVEGDEVVRGMHSKTGPLDE